MQKMMALALLAGAGMGAHAQDVSITLTNELGTGGFSVTPVWFAFHNGGFDSYNGGEPASNFPGLTELAENGNTGPITDAFAASAAAAAGGLDGTLVSSTGAPVFTPGESQTFDNINVGDSSVNRYFSFASMVVPTNDLFIANGDPFAHEIFDAAGNFNGPLTIQIFGADVNDNGSEVNNAFGGAAFSVNGGDRADENGLIRNFFTVAGDEDYLASFIGTGTPDGGTITSAFGAGDLIATIRIVPAPSSIAAIGLGGLLVSRRRR